ncbi:hypothetical protein GLU01_01745 [Nanohaloarchaea archaeon]|nr:hypothetical protein [Candidatus Nanohaloarchaea archaeon]
MTDWSLLTGRNRVDFWTKRFELANITGADITILPTNYKRHSRLSGVGTQGGTHTWEVSNKHISSTFR